VPDDLVPRDELQATLAARRELGPEYEDELVESFARRIEERLQERPPQPQRVVRKDPSQVTAITIVSILAAIPMIAIAGGTVGVPGVALVCLALVLINYFAHR
jgi:hypothetical protein